MDVDLSLAIGDRGLRSFALAFAITQLVEVPIYMRALAAGPVRSGGVRSEQAQRGDERSGDAQSRDAQSRDAQSRDARSDEGKQRQRSAAVRAAIGFGASAITHPIVWFAMPAIAMGIYGAAVRAGAPALGATGRVLFYGALAEGLAVMVEAAYLRALGVRRALLWSIGANAASVVVGTLAVWTLG